MITVYHGSSIEVPNPSLNYGREDTDFGLGFYVSEDYNMAEKWACRKGMSVISTYQLDIDSLSCYDFSLDETWLDFVVSNRNGYDSNINITGFDLLKGATADDKLFSTIEQYENGFISKDIAIKLLNCMNVGNQICIKTQNGLEKLHYIGKTIVAPNRKQIVQKQNIEDRKTANHRVKEILQQINKPSNLSKRFDKIISTPSDADNKNIVDKSDSFSK